MKRYFFYSFMNKSHQGAMRYVTQGGIPSYDQLIEHAELQLKEKGKTDTVGIMIIGFSEFKNEHEFNTFWD